MSFVTCSSWQDTLLVITPQFFIPRTSSGKHKRLNGLLAYDMPIHDPEQCNLVIDRSMFLIRVGMEYSEKHQAYLIQAGWKEDVMKLLRESQKAGGCVPGQTHAIPCQPRSLVKAKSAKQLKQSTSKPPDHEQSAPGPGKRKRAEHL